MQQFLRAKEQYPDALLFFRLGDFYEMFFEDAVVAAELLGIAQTYRGSTPEGEKIPMAGVPHHAANSYLTKLLKLGQKVAICEQMADPKKIKGVVPREVVRVVTPGLCLEEDALDAKADNYLVSIVQGDTTIGIAALELSTGQLRVAELADRTAALAELVRLDPREILLSKNDPLDLSTSIEQLLKYATIREYLYEDQKEIFKKTLSEDMSDLLRVMPNVALSAAATVLGYAQSNQPSCPIAIQHVGFYDPCEHLVMDESAVRNLELIRTLSGERRGSLLHLIDVTKTSMGARLLRRRLLAPLTELAAIRRRHDAVEAFVLDEPLRLNVRALLSGIGDLERMATRASMGVATPRDLGVVRNALGRAAELLGVLNEHASLKTDDTLLRLIPSDNASELYDLLETALVDDLPINAKDGGLIREKVDADLDELRTLSSKSKDVILQLEQRERKRTGINSLKIKFTRVFGYYIEVTRSNLGSVPSDYIRKQTVANGERYITSELDELQQQILHADDRAKQLEQRIFEELRERVATFAAVLRALAQRLAMIDVTASLAECAHRFGYCRPKLDDSLKLELRDARHPIVENVAGAGTFVPNDLDLDAESQRLMILTGPNMAGKSTVMRQVALCVVLAQAGSFVPAKYAHIGIVDRLYTRVGASDNLGEGQSTFMVEMREAAMILRGATQRSLVILDEIGRGTSTYDGLAIAWAVAEYLHDTIACRGMFATHYHELCELPLTCDGASNFNVAAREYGDNVVFLHKLVPGSANRSYGIAVARLAGVPAAVLTRATSILSGLEAGAALPSGGHARMRPLDAQGKAQLELFHSPAPSAEETSNIMKILRELDVDRLTPMEALLMLSELKKESEKIEG